MTQKNIIEQSILFKYRCNHIMVSVSFLFLFLFSSFPSKAGKEPPYEEISVFLSMPMVGNIEIPALIKDQELYLPITNVFNLLKINNKISQNLDSVSGFFINEKSIYLVDKASNLVIYNEKIYELQPDDLIRTETNLYLKASYFGKVFGVECKFNFRSLSVLLETKLDVPVLLEMRQELIRSNVKKLKGEIKADTIIGLRHSLFQLGMADWSLHNIQQKGNNQTTINLKLGAMIAGGEATLGVMYNNKVPFNLSHQNYLWRHVNNKNPYLRQVSIGKIPTQATSTIFAPVIGAQFSNNSTIRRQSFGTYVLSNTTEPGWTVELYVNNVLVDYVRADASGFYTFNVPLIYGNTMVRLRFFGPSGEERFSEQNISVPFNFLPVNIFEYAVNAGILEDANKSKFSRAHFNYGLSRRLTVGAGVEYLSSVVTGKTMPFLSSTARLTSDILMSAEYTHGVRSKAILTYHRPTNLQLELNYTKYAKAQKAINNNFLEESRATLSMPWRKDKIFLFSRFTLSQVVAPTISYDSILRTKYSDIPKQKSTTTELMLSGSISKLSVNLTTFGVFQEVTQPSLYSNLSLSYRFPKGLVIRPQVQFNYKQGNFITARTEIEKQLMSKGYVNFTFERNISMKTSNITLGLRYDLSFARTAFSASRNNKTTTLFQSASGSLMYDAATSYFNTSNRNSTSRGGITLAPFLDVNCNGKREKNEPNVFGLKFRINGGRVIRNEQQSIIRIVDLEPYANYMLELDGNSFGNIAWQIKNKNISVVIDPNVFKLIEIPVAVMGEASGMVLINKAGEQKGISRILVNFYDIASRLVAQTLSEGDGYFSYLGLAPGSYIARIDTAQLHKLNLTSFPDTRSFHIAGSEEGVVADGFEFVLKSLSDTGNYLSDIQKITQPVVENKKIVVAENIAPSLTDKIAAAEKTNKQQPVSKTKIAVDANQQTGNEKITIEQTTNKLQASASHKIKGVADNKTKPGKAQTAEQNKKIARQQTTVDNKNSVVPEKQKARESKPSLTEPKTTKKDGRAKIITTPQKATVSPTVKTSTQPIKSGRTIKLAYRVPTSKQLIRELQNQNKKDKDAFKAIQLLLIEQQQLIDAQKKLLREIRDLKLQLLQKNSIK